MHLSSDGQQDLRWNVTVWGMLAEMEREPVVTPWVATVAEAVTVARLLDAFNREYRTPTPGPRSWRHGCGGCWPAQR